MKKRAPLLPLCAGLVCGAGTTWIALHLCFTSGSAPRASGVDPVFSTSSASALVLPAILQGSDADAALDAYLALPPIPEGCPDDALEERIGRLRALLTILPASHYARLFSVLAALPGTAGEAQRRVAFEIWTELDAPAASRWAFALVPNETINAAARARLLGKAALTWARDDFDAAYAWIGEFADATLRRTLSTSLLTQLATTAPRRAVALAQAAGDDFFRGCRVPIFRAWADQDPASALRELAPAAFDVPEMRGPIQQAMADWAGREPSSALAWVEARFSSDDEKRRSMLNSLAWALAAKPGAIAPFITLLERLSGLPGREGVVPTYLTAWIREDSPAAISWLDTITDPARRSDLVFNVLGLANPDDFPALVRRLPPGPARDSKIWERLMPWAQNDPDKVLAWLEKTDAPELKFATEKVKDLLIAKTAATDPVSAISRWQTIEDAGERWLIAEQIAVRWAASDPAASLRWIVEQLPSDAAKDGATKDLLYKLNDLAVHWARRDPKALVDWAGTLPEPQRDQLLQSVANVYWTDGNNSPEPPPRAAYADLLEQISDPVLRLQALETHLRAWKRADLLAAQAWIESSDALSPQDAASLLSRHEVEP